ncbi:type I secretion system permease/ATPase [Paracoccus sp. Z330]|uniref:Type I secretion system permease/ATPase n=1 Tax=Paracoccus onchidii TaxID=3017813 RepID=A0ABT4ZH82_9RHOB|nr:type I secretion system permease/ATPase [Paracoccus onchidii]MDB6178720.1 type I secretion system permease/ATPase [Paracoccus onchidii]
MTPSEATVSTRAKGDITSQWNFSAKDRDHLAQAVAYCCRLEGRDIATASLIAGLALPVDAMLTPELACTAAERQGFRARLVRSALPDLPDAVLPAVLFLNGRDACVLLSRAEQTVKLFWPARSDQVLELALNDLAQNYSGHALLLRHDDASIEDMAAVQPSSRHWYWGVAARFWPDYMQVAVASAMVNLLALIMPIFTMNVYDRVFPNAALTTLWSLVAGVGIALSFDALLKWLRAAVVERVSRQVDQAVSADIFRHVADLRLESRTMASGNLMNTLKDYEQVRDFFSSQTLATLTDLGFAVLFIAVIAYLGGPLALPPAAALLVVLIMGIAILWPLRRASNQTRQTQGQKNAVAVEAISELESLKAVAGQGRMQGRWEDQVANSARAQEQSRSLALFATTLTGLAQQLASIGIVVIGVYLALDGQLTMGTVIAAMILSGRALAPTTMLANLFVRASFAFSTLKSLNQIMSLPSDNTPRSDQLNVGVAEGAISAEGVSLQYPDAPLPALEGLSLTIAPNERIAVIGAVGAGKTSMVRLLAGLYRPSTGMMLIDGLNMSQISPARLRRDVQLVPQEAVLFSGTLAENIAFGNPQASAEDIVHAARIVGVDRIAARHPSGFAMPISERGRNLSGGQRQLVALARALLLRPKVLVLDEPTSAMDQQSEKVFIQSLARVMQHHPMTLIISTHRMGLLALVDRIILLDNGQVLQDGPKADILARLAAPSEARA